MSVLRRLLLVSDTHKTAAQVGHSRYVAAVCRRSLFGWENVRGSSYCKVQMFNAPDALKAFARDRDGDFEYLSRDEIDAVLEAIRELEELGSS